MTFVKSKSVLRVIHVAEYTHKRPSEILNIDNDWYAFCVDEALTYIGIKSKDKNEVMVWDNTTTVTRTGKTEVKTVSPGAFYKQFET